MRLHETRLLVNGVSRTLALPRHATLLTVLRNDFALNGPKYGCGRGACGACTILVDGIAARACVIPAVAVSDRPITTLEGLATVDPDGRRRLHPVQQAFIDAQAAQCGYCLNGMIMATVALLADNARPGPAEIRAALCGNLCRCGTHLEILAAVDLAVRRSGSGEAVAARRTGGIAEAVAEGPHDVVAAGPGSGRPSPA